MPFSKASELDKSDLDYIYEHILKSAVEAYQKDGKQYFPIVERFNNKVGSIVTGIVNNLNTAELVIADLTGLNPNVMYELGVRHSLRRGTIIITQEINNLPSDLRDYLTVGYKYSKTTTEQPANFERFKTEMHKSIDEVLSTNKYDSPVLSYLQQKQRFKDEADVERLKSNAVIIETISNICDEIWDLIINYEKANLSETQEFTITQLFNLKFNNLTTALAELNIPYESSILYENIITSKTLIAEINKFFGMQEYFITTMGNLPDVPRGVLGKGITNEFYINKPIVDLYALLDNEKLIFTTMKELFSPDGRIALELLDYLEEYIENKARSLDVDLKEIEELLRR
ncbi:MAG: hypothetical protein A2W91_13660 [Bacteroidetes bacterium GWF2_38_335]|nr:MAG: hypothetical protein A2W91_13660 [Bacteroidetes bacterium GWF2_38_335]OFY77296.1 MAG: hypothetical protein A2281_15325 [Bacteroidetes bacterium RIFOXYA12_FULL_38_20]HBS85699.1 hypothetical protein [Bacteroidales bacterium]